MKSDGCRFVHGEVDHFENGIMRVVVDAEENDLQLHGTTLVCTDVTTNMFVVVRGWIWENLQEWYAAYDMETRCDSEESEYASDSENDSSDGDDDDIRTKTAKKRKSNPR